MYNRQVRTKPNLNYKDIDKETVLYLFCILQNNGIDNIKKETGYGRDFIRKTLEK